MLGVPVSKGILVRITEKIARMSNLLETEAQVEDETIDDTIRDAITYLAIVRNWLIDQRPLPEVAAVGKDFPPVVRTRDHANNDHLLGDDRKEKYLDAEIQT
jgi:hypothetical protein